MPLQPRAALILALACLPCVVAAQDAAVAPAAATPAPPDRSLMVDVPGGRVYVRINGDLKGPHPPVVFIHGGPGGTHRGYIAALPLADERAVILFDQIDTGASERRNDKRNWTVPTLVASLEAIRTALGIERWHVSGGSWGGTMALEYGAAHPERVASLTLASPLISTKSWIADARYWRAQLPAKVQRDLTACEATRKPAKDVCDAAETEYSKRHLRRGPPLPEVVAYKPPAGGNGEMYQTMWGPTEFTATGTLRNYNGEPLLAKLPGDRTLFMTGQYDEARPETLMRFAQRVPGAEVAIIPGAAHATMNDRRDEVLAVLRGFFRRHDAPASTTADPAPPR